MLSIEIQTAGLIAMKFGMKEVLKGGRFLDGFWPGTTTPLGMSPLKGA